MRRILLLCIISIAATALAQQRGAPTIPRPPFGDGPFTFDTAEQHKIRVVVVTKGLSHPWGLAFLPDGSMLVTERAGRIRLVKDGVLDPNPIPGVPKVFAQDGNLFMTVGGTFDQRAQDPMNHGGKVLRLRDDGTAPPDNPFVGRSGYKPEIFSLGHRNALGLAIHPETRVVWENENGPNGGDELNIILPGRNYGWPVVSYGRNYPGPRVSDHAWKEGMEEPLVVWLPSIGISGLTIYSGDRFPAWKGNAFVGSMRWGELNYTGHLERVVFNAKFEELRRETLLTDLRQRIRDVRQGPDGLLYVLTEEDDGALLRIEPAP